MTLCFCDHRWVSHEVNGACTIRGCPCIIYQQVLGGVRKVAADYDLRRHTKLKQADLGGFS